MLTRLLSRRARHEEQMPVEAATGAPAAVLSREDSLLLFVPDAGGMSFRLFTVQDEETASAFVRQQFPQLGGKPLLFRPFRTGARVDADQQGEVLVVIADPSRPGTVYLSAFEDTDSAESFARFEVRNGLDPNLVTVHPGMPLIIETAPASGPYSTPVPARPAPVGTVAVPRTASQPVTPLQPLPAQPAVTAHVAPPAAIPTPQPRVAPQPSVAPQVRVNAAQPRVVAQPKVAAKAKAAPQKTKEARPGIVDSIRAWPGWDTLAERINAASTLKWEMYEEVKKDPIASSQARVIVAAAVAAGGLGSFWVGPVAVVLYTVAGLLGWLAVAHLSFWVGTVVFPGRGDADNKQLLFKAIGLCQAPRIILAIGIVLPVIGIVVPGLAFLMPLIVLGIVVWVVVAMVPATEYALEIDRESAILTAITAGFALFTISFVLPAVLV